MDEKKKEQEQEEDYEDKMVKRVVKSMVGKTTKQQNDQQETDNELEELAQQIGRDPSVVKKQKQLLNELRNPRRRTVTNNVNKPLQRIKFITLKSNIPNSGILKTTTFGFNVLKSGTLKEKKVKSSIPKFGIQKTNILKISTLKFNVSKIGTLEKEENKVNVPKTSTLKKINIPKIDTLRSYENITNDDLLRLYLLVSKIEQYIFQSTLSYSEKEILRAVLYYAPDSNEFGYGQFVKALNNTMTRQTAKKAITELKQKGFLINIQKQSGRYSSAPYFESLLQEMYRIMPSLSDIMPLSYAVNMISNLPYQIYKVLDNVCMYVCNSNFSNTHTNVNKEEHEPKDKIEKQIEDELIDLIFKADLLGVDHEKISDNVLNQLYKFLSIPSNIQNAKDWQKQTHIITVKNDLLYSIYYMLKQKNVKHPWNYTIKIYKEGLYDNLTQEQKQELDKLLKDIQNLQDESYLYDEVTKKEILDKISKFNFPVKRFEELTGPELRKEIIKHFKSLKQKVKYVIEKHNNY